MNIEKERREARKVLAAITVRQGLSAIQIGRQVRMNDLLVRDLLEALELAGLVHVRQIRQYDSGPLVPAYFLGPPADPRPAS